MSTPDAVILIPGWLIAGMQIYLMAVGSVFVTLIVGGIGFRIVQAIIRRVSP